jgi:hypothetical protein
VKKNFTFFFRFFSDRVVALPANQENGHFLALAHVLKSRTCLLNRDDVSTGKSQCQIPLESAF